MTHPVYPAAVGCDLAPRLFSQLWRSEQEYMHFGHQGTDSRKETGVSYSLMKRWSITLSQIHMHYNKTKYILYSTVNQNDSVVVI